MDIAICVIAYDRIESLKRVLRHINKATYSQSSKLYISIDHSDNKYVEKYAQDFHWEHGEKEIILHETKLGLRQHILSCGELLHRHEALIVLEDDIVVSPDFFNYAQVTVNKFHEDESIAGISLYSFPITYHSLQPFTPLPSDSDIYLMQNAQSWGQVWMRKQWFNFKEWYNQNKDDFNELPYLPKSICNWPESSWLKYHTRYCIEKNKFFIYPYHSRSTCFADIGEHTSQTTSIYQTPLLDSPCKTFRLTPTVKYNCYFENILIPTWLNIPAIDICIDFYCDNGNREKKRYWLTPQYLPYKIIKSFGLRMKPYELNIKYNIHGNDLFLYDTMINANITNNEDNSATLHFYLYKTHKNLVPTQEEILYSKFGRYTNLFTFEMLIIAKTRKYWHKITNIIKLYTS